MDRGSSVLSLYASIYCIFQTTRFSNGEPNVCPCPEIPLVNLTETPPTDCFPINGTFRYKCKAGYVREAGTSNLIRCIQTGNVVEWSTLTLKCKRDPRRKTMEHTNPPPIGKNSETTNIDTTSTGLTASDSLLAGKNCFLGKATNTPAPHLTAENHTAVFMLDPKYAVSSSVVLVCIVVLVGGIIYHLCKRRTSTVDCPPSAEQIPMANDSSELSE